MLELKKNEVETWKLLNGGNLVLTKSETIFMSIGRGHAIEQKHKKMNIRCGFVRMTGNQQILEKYFIFTPLLSNFANEFKEHYHVN